MKKKKYSLKLQSAKSLLYQQHCKLLCLPSYCSCINHYRLLAKNLQFILIFALNVSMAFPFQLHQFYSLLSNCLHTQSNSWFCVFVAEAIGNEVVMVSIAEQPWVGGDGGGHWFMLSFLCLIFTEWGVGMMVLSLFLFYLIILYGNI